MGANTGRPRKPKSAACDSCHRRKIKCLPVGLQCEWCATQSLECTFERGSRSAKKDTYKASRHCLIQNHATPIEYVGHNGSTEPPAISSISSSRPDIAQSPVSSGPASCRELHSVGHVPSNMRNFAGLPFFSIENKEWIRMCTKDGSKLDLFCSFATPWRLQRRDVTKSTESFFRTHGHIGLPNKELVYRCLRLFKSSALSCWFPMINTELFEHTINAAYDGKTTTYSPHIASAKACVFAFVSFVSLSHGPNILRNEKKYAYANEARYLLPDIFQDMATLDGIQTFIILSLHSVIYSGDIFPIDILTSTASRFIFALGGNNYSPISENPSLFQAHCRVLFWMVYVMDKELCLRTGRPPTLNDEDCDLTLPSKEDIQHLCPWHPQIHSSSQYLLLLFPTDLRLSIIYSKIYKGLLSATAQRKSDAELLQTIRDLDDTLEQWRKDMPQDDMLLFHPFGALSPTDVEQRSRLLFLQYHHSLSTIHQTSTSCAAWAEDENKQLEGIVSSLEVAANASRSLLRQFSTDPAGADKGFFWYPLYYLTSAVITVFCCILRDPLNPQVEGDIKLLRETTSYFKALEDSPESAENLGHGTLIQEFIVEMSHLAGRAVHQASLFTDANGNGRADLARP